MSSARAAGAGPALRPRRWALPDRTGARLARRGALRCATLARPIAYRAPVRAAHRRIGAMRACARAWLAGRDYVIAPTTSAPSRPDVLRHRKSCSSYEATAEGWDGDRLAKALLDVVPLCSSSQLHILTSTHERRKYPSHAAGTDRVARERTAASSAWRRGRHSCHRTLGIVMRARWWEYAELREYVAGDDAPIDWRLTARQRTCTHTAVPGRTRATDAGSSPTRRRCCTSAPALQVGAGRTRQCGGRIAGHTRWRPA